jgi:hypothetical protein
LIGRFGQAYFICLNNPILLFQGGRNMTTKNARYNVLARYEEGSNTIRKVPENYCLIAFTELREPIFAIDAATMPYRSLVEGAWGDWVKSEGISKDTLAALVSVVLKDYRPFAQYPTEWDSDDVFNALRLLSSADESVTELEHKYRDSSQREWETSRSGDKAAHAAAKTELNELVHGIWHRYYTAFPRPETTGMDIYVFVPITEDTVQEKAKIFVGPHACELAEAAFKEHTGVAYVDFEQADDKDAILSASDTIGSYITVQKIATPIQVTVERGMACVTNNPHSVPVVIIDLDVEQNG